MAAFEDGRGDSPLLVRPDELVLLVTLVVACRQLEVEVGEAEVAEQSEDEVEQVLDLVRRLLLGEYEWESSIVRPRTRVRPCTTPDFS